MQDIVQNQKVKKKVTRWKSVEFFPFLVLYKVKIPLQMQTAPARYPRNITK